MRISDWSSDVCSSDLVEAPGRSKGDALHDDPVAIGARRPGERDDHRQREAGEEDDEHAIHEGHGVERGDPTPFGREPENEAEQHRSEEHTSELQSLMRISYAVFCLKKKKKTNKT